MTTTTNQERDEAMRETRELVNELRRIDSRGGLGQNVHDALRRTIERIEWMADAIDAAELAHARLDQFADAANAGTVQAGGRELKRKVWGVFAEFDALSRGAPPTNQEHGEG
jgi:hypothetical protein